MSDAPAMVDHERIWLEPGCDGNSFAGEGRTWCQDNVYDPCPDCGAEATEYVRADLSAAELTRLRAEVERLRSALKRARNDLSAARFATRTCHDSPLSLADHMAAGLPSINESIEIADAALTLENPNDCPQPPAG